MAFLAKQIQARLIRQPSAAKGIATGGFECGLLQSYSLVNSLTVMILSPPASQPSIWRCAQRRPSQTQVQTGCMETVTEKCISRESNPGHIDGNDVFYH